MIYIILYPLKERKGLVCCIVGSVCKWAMFCEMTRSRYPTPREARHCWVVTNHPECNWTRPGENIYMYFLSNPLSRWWANFLFLAVQPVCEFTRGKLKLVLHLDLEVALNMDSRANSPEKHILDHQLPTLNEWPTVLTIIHWTIKHIEYSCSDI